MEQPADFWELDSDKLDDFKHYSMISTKNYARPYIMQVIASEGEISERDLITSCIKGLRCARAAD